MQNGAHSRAGGSFQEYVTVPEQDLVGLSLACSQGALMLMRMPVCCMWNQHKLLGTALTGLG